MKKIFDFSLTIIVVIAQTILPGCKKEKVPIITTTSVSNITASAATCGGNITEEGSSTVLARGVCWSTGITPTIDDCKTTDGAGIGSFSSNIRGLLGAKIYYVRAYATNSNGTGYGMAMSLTTTPSAGIVRDVEGNIYNTITIGTQVWMRENMKTAYYFNSELIGTTTPSTKDLTNESTPKYQWAYNGDESKVATYGRLYTWYAITDNRKICPIDWHVPSGAEWTTLTDYLTNNGYGYGGSGNLIAKSMASMSWTTDGTAGNVGNDQASNNSSGFTGLPSGWREYDGKFFLIGSSETWWSSTEKDAMNASTLGVVWNNKYVHRGDADKRMGFSVRCLRDY